MPQAKSSRAKRSSSSKSTAKRSTAKRSTAKRSTASTKRSTTAKRSTAKRGTSARRAPAARTDDAAIRRLTDARELLEKAVVLTRDRIQEAMDDAVERGRMTRDDAEQLVQELIKRGRKQTEEVRSDLEQLLGRGRGAAVLADAGKDARRRVTTAAKVAGRTPVADRARREVDRARRAAGVGPTFPILGYDDLTAGQVTASLDDLTPAELRKVRDYERRNANRKSVLNAVEKKLA